MYQTINEYAFRDTFMAIRPNDFTYAGLTALFEYLEEEEAGEGIELDVIAICCEFTEFIDFTEIQGDYDNVKTIGELRELTTVIVFNGGIIIQNF